MTWRGGRHGWGILGALGVVVLVGVLVLWARTPRPDDAQGAVTGGLVLSTDRVHWGPTLSEPLFDPDQPWSPGQTGSRDVYVRNDGSTVSGVQVSVGTNGSNLADAGWAVVSARAEGQSWTSLQEPGSFVLLRDLSLGPGEVQTIQLRAMVDSAASAQAMSRELDIDVDVRPDGTLADRSAASQTLWPAADLPDKSLTALAGGLLALIAIRLARHRRAEAGT